MRLLLCFVVLLLGTTQVQAQAASPDELAQYYMDEGQYDKALLYYEKLYSTSGSAMYYNRLLECYMQLEQYKDAAKLVRSHQKRTRNSVFLLDLAAVYRAEGDDAQAEKVLREVIDDLQPNQSQITQLANKFIQINELEKALEVYQRGRKMLNGSYPFSYEMAMLYSSMGRYEEMITEYLSLLEFNEAYIQNVQNGLARSIDFEENNERVTLLRTQLLKLIQKHPEKTIYSEMLIWIHLQQKDFEAAFVQTRALDKRMNEGGRRLISLGHLSAGNGDYEQAARSFQYVITNYPEGEFTPQAREAYLEAEFNRLSAMVLPPAEATEALRLAFEEALNERLPADTRVFLKRRLGAVLALYQGKRADAIGLLQTAVSEPGASLESRSQAKLELADYLLAQNDIWDASLLYSQVEKDFKYDVLGYQAKFNNARLSYFTGDFSWAQAQLDVLKGSTTKLISNDAIDLSLLITDNLALDTIATPMEMFARAELLTFQRRFDEAVSTLDSITTQYPGHALSDEIHFERAEIARKTGKPEDALSELQTIIDYHSGDIVADNALFLKADILQHDLDRPEEAKEVYRQLLGEYPGSLLVTEARRRFRLLRGDNLESTPQLIDKTQ